MRSSERFFAARVAGGLLLGVDLGYLVDGDLGGGATVTSVKAAVDVDSAKGGPGKQILGERVKSSVEQVSNFDAAYLTGGDADATTTVSPTTIRGATVNF